MSAVPVTRPPSVTAARKSTLEPTPAWIVSVPVLVAAPEYVWLPVVRSVMPAARVESPVTDRLWSATAEPIDPAASRSAAIVSDSCPAVVPSTASAKVATPRVAPSSRSSTTSPVSVVAWLKSTSPPSVTTSPAVEMPDGAERVAAVPPMAPEMMSPAAVIASVVPAVTVSVRSTVMPEIAVRGVTAATVPMVKSSTSRNTTDPVSAASVAMSLVASDRFQSLPAPSSPRPPARIARPWPTVEAVPPEIVTSRTVPVPASIPVVVTVCLVSRASSTVVSWLIE